LDTGVDSYELWDDNRFYNKYGIIKVGYADVLGIIAKTTKLILPEKTLEAHRLILDKKYEKKRDTYSGTYMFSGVGTRRMFLNGGGWVGEDVEYIKHHPVCSFFRGLHNSWNRIKNCYGTMYQTPEVGSSIDYWLDVVEDSILNNVKERNHTELDWLVHCIDGGACFVLCADEICFVSKYPRVDFDDTGMIHSEERAAFEHSQIKRYCLRGINYEKPMWEKIVSRTVNGKEIIALENTEQKSVAIQFLGLEHILKDCRATVLAEQKMEHGVYQVIEVDLEDDATVEVPGNFSWGARRFVGAQRPQWARFVKVVCTTTGKETFLRVDPRNEHTKDPMGAIAWTFNMTKNQYSPVKET
jgi:hypothetical protein